MTYYGGLNLPEVAEGELMMEAIVMFKVLTPEGVKYREFKTSTLHSVEALGMVSTMVDTLRAKIMRSATGRWET